MAETIQVQVLSIETSTGKFTENTFMKINLNAYIVMAYKCHWSSFHNNLVLLWSYAEALKWTVRIVYPGWLMAIAGTSSSWVQH